MSSSTGREVSGVVALLMVAGCGARSDLLLSDRGVIGGDSGALEATLPPPAWTRSRGATRARRVTPARATHGPARAAWILTAGASLLPALS